MPFNYDESIKKAMEINSRLIFREAAPEDAPALADLMNKTYARKRTGDYFIWQYFSQLQPAKLFIANNEGVPVGIYGLQIKPTTGGLCGSAIDSLVDEPFRGRGIFNILENNALTYARDSGAKFIATLPNRPGMIVRHRQLGWNVIGKIDQLEVEASSAPRLIEKLLEKVKTMPNDDIQMLNKKLNYFIKEKNFWSWRYEQNPIYKYERVLGKKSSFAVIKIFTDPITKKVYGDVVDFSCDLSDIKSILGLYLSACRRLQARGARIIATWILPHLTLAKILVESGFKAVIQERYFCVKLLGPEFFPMLDINNWHLTQGDTEFY